MIFPYSKRKLRTRLSLSTVAKRLEQVTSDRTVLPFLFARPDASFVGLVRGDSFEVRPLIHGRNPFLPVIDGQIVPEPNDSASLEFRLSPDPIVAGVVVVGSFTCVLGGHAAAAIAVLFVSIASFVLSARHAYRRLDSVLARTEPTERQRADEEA